MGPTNAGKSTLLERSRNDLGLSVGCVEVGKALRAKYPPSHFQGLANPKHTAAEAWDLFVGGLRDHQDKQVIFVDGQPRDTEQASAILSMADPVLRTDVWPDLRLGNFYFILLDCPEEIRKERAERRCVNPEDLALAQARIKTDYESVFRVLSVLLRDRTTKLSRLEVADTTYGVGEAMKVVESILSIEHIS